MERKTKDSLEENTVLEDIMCHALKIQSGYLSLK